MVFTWTISSASNVYFVQVPVSAAKANAGLDFQTVLPHSIESLTFAGLYLFPVGTATTLIQLVLLKKKTLACLLLPSLTVPLITADIQQKVYQQNDVTCAAQHSLVLEWEQSFKPLLLRCLAMLATHLDNSYTAEQLIMPVFESRESGKCQCQAMTLLAFWFSFLHFYCHPKKSFCHQEFALWFSIKLICCSC